MASSGSGARIGVIGATGALGQELLAALERSSLRVSEILPVATEQSLGQEIEFKGEDYPVMVAEPGVGEFSESGERGATGSATVGLRGLDLVLLAAPPVVSLEYARAALRAEVPCIDLSGALADAAEVPLRVADLAGARGVEGLPMIATPVGAALPWSLVLAPLQAAAGLRRVVGTVFEAASSAGSRGIEALQIESVALFNQQDPPDPAIFPWPIAFDCIPALGDEASDGATAREAQVARSLGRLLEDGPRVFATAVQVPAFAGQAASLAIETERPLDPKQAREILAAAPSVELFEGAAPSLRSVSGSDHVGVGRVRSDPSTESGIGLWLAADLLSLAAASAARLAVARLQAH